MSHENKNIYTSSDGQYTGFHQTNPTVPNHFGTAAQFDSIVTVAGTTTNTSLSTFSKGIIVGENTDGGEVIGQLRRNGLDLEFYNGTSWESVNGGGTSAYNRRTKVLSIADNTIVPPTEVLGDRYILDFTVGTTSTSWDGAAKGDIVQFNGTTWDATTPVEGWIAYVDDSDLDALYVDDGTPAWELRTAGSGETNTASNQGAGVGVFDNKNVADLEFRSLVSPTGKVTIALDAGNKEIDLGVSLTSSDVGLSSVTDDAQLKRAAADYNSFTLKGTPIAADVLLIEDSADSFNKKKITLTDLLGGGGIGGSITDNQIAVGATTANSIEGSAELTYDTSTGAFVLDKDVNSDISIKATNTNNHADARTRFIATSDSGSGSFLVASTLFDIGMFENPTAVGNKLVITSTTGVDSMLLEVGNNGPNTVDGTTSGSGDLEIALGLIYRDGSQGAGYYNNSVAQFWTNYVGNTNNTWGLYLGEDARNNPKTDRLQLHDVLSRAIHTRYSNATTGKADNRGFRVGIDASENAEFINYQTTDTVWYKSNVVGTPIEFMRYDQSDGRLELADSSIQVGSTATAGHVLTTDASGVGTWQAATGNVTKVGTPVDDQLAVWTGDGTLEGESALVYAKGTNSVFKYTSSGNYQTFFELENTTTGTLSETSLILTSDTARTSIVTYSDGYIGSSFGGAVNKAGTTYIGSRTVGSSSDLLFNILGSHSIYFGTADTLALTIDTSQKVVVESAFQFKASPTNGHVLTSDASGNASWSAAGTGTIGGSITDNQIAVGATTADDIEGSSGLTWDGTKFTLTGTSAASTRETLFKGSTSDGGNDAFELVNGTGVDGRFAPVFSGYIDSTNSVYSLGARALVSAANDASDSSTTGLFNVEVLRTDSSADPNNGTFSAVVNRKLFTVSNAGTSYPVIVHADDTTELKALKIPTGATNNYVLTSDASGVGTWQAATGGIGGSIADNQIAVGATTADDIEGSADLTYDNGEVVLQKDHASPTNITIKNETNGANSSAQVTVKGVAGGEFAAMAFIHPTHTTNSLYDGIADFGAFFTGADTLGSAYLHFGSGDHRWYIGTEDLVDRHMVLDTTRLQLKNNSIQIGSTATAGHVLTTDASGVGTWQAAPAGGISGSGVANKLTYWTGSGSVDDAEYLEYDAVNGHLTISNPSESANTFLQFKNEAGTIVGSIEDGSGAANGGGTIYGATRIISNGNAFGFYGFTSNTSAADATYGFNAAGGTPGAPADHDTAVNILEVRSRASAAYVERLVMTGDGNIGIGVSDPDVPLEVAGNIRAENNFNGLTNVTATNTTAGTDSRASLSATTSGGGNASFGAISSAYVESLAAGPNTTAAANKGFFQASTLLDALVVSANTQGVATTDGTTQGDGNIEFALGVINKDGGQGAGYYNNSVAQFWTNYVGTTNNTWGLYLGEDARNNPKTDRLQLHDVLSRAIYTRYSNATTGKTDDNGLRVGIDADENAVFRNYENTDCIWYANDSEFLRWDESANYLKLKRDVASTATYLRVENTNSSGTSGFYAIADNGGVVYQALGSTEVASGYPGYGRMRSDGGLLGLVFATGGTGDPLIFATADTEVMRLLDDMILGSGEGEDLAASANSTTLRSPDLLTGGTSNQAGTNLTLTAGKGKGTGTVGKIILQTPRVGTTGTTLHSVSTLLELEEATAKVIGDQLLVGQNVTTPSDITISNADNVADTSPRTTFNMTTDQAALNCEVYNSAATGNFFGITGGQAHNVFVGTPVSQTQGQMIVGTLESIPLNLGTDGTLAVTIDTFQNVTIDNGTFQPQKRLLGKLHGSTIASATNITLGTDGNLFEITGTTTIDRIDSTDWTEGSEVVLHFAAALTLNHATALSGNNYGMILKTGSNEAVSADSVKKFILRNTNWYEI